MPIILDSSSTDIAPLASKLLSARGIGELALQKIGAYTPNDEGADPGELDRALEWMEIEIAELVETNRNIQWLIPATITVELEANVQSFDLANLAGGDYPSLGIAYPILAAINSGTATLAYDAQTANFVVGDRITGGTTGSTARITDDTDSGTSGTLTLSHITGSFADNEIITSTSSGSATVNGAYQATQWTTIDMVRRSYFEANFDGSSGDPSFVYIDRQNDRPQVHVHPVPDDDTVSLRLLVQTYARSVLGDLADSESGDVPHGFARGWQKWLVNQTAAAIGSGPVRRLDSKTLSDIRTEAGASLVLLLRQNKENQSLRLRRTKRYGG